MNLRSVSILILLSAALQARSQAVYNEQDSLIFEACIKDFADKSSHPIGNLIKATAHNFIAVPYVASTLETEDNERLIVNLREFDCTTLVESCIALSTVIKSGDLSFGNYCLLLTYIRYRDSEIEGYPSRLHYTSDWIYENEKRNILQNISAELGGKIVRKKVGYMSEHPLSYKQLANNPDNLQRIKEIENHINNRDSYIVIPKYAISAKENAIKDGDIIAFATSIDGLDYSHMGIAYWLDDKLHFIHASSKAGQVIIEPKTLAEYCMNSKRCTGISVLRILE